MSIIAYVGLPGSGKSYDVVANQIIPALKNNRIVVTNIPLNLDAIREDVATGEVRDFPLEQIQGQPELIDELAVPGCVLVIDECWRIWPAGARADKIPQPFKSYLAEHRHRVDQDGRATQICLVTQDLAQISAFARQLVEQTFNHTKLTSVGARGSYRIDIYHGAITGAVPPVNNRIRHLYGRYKKSVFKYYKSHTMSESASSGADEVAMDTRGNLFKRFGILAGLIGAPIVALAGIAYVVHFFTSGGGALAAEGSEAGAPVEQSSTHREIAASPAPSPPRFRPQWRITGILEVGSGGVAMLTDGQRVTRLSLKSCRLAGTWSCPYDGVVATYDWPAVADEDRPRRPTFSMD